MASPIVVSIEDIKRKLEISSDDDSYDNTISTVISDYKEKVMHEKFTPREIAAFSQEKMERLHLGITLYLAGRVLLSRSASSFLLSGGSVTVGPIRVAEMGGFQASHLEKSGRRMMDEGLQILDTLRVEESYFIRWKAV